MAPEGKDESLETDEFVYPDQVLNAMEYSLQKCNECNSRDISDLELISHSMSNDDMTALFSTLNKFDVILDVGSRTGCVLYAAYLMTKARNIIGVEIDADWCKMQNKIIHQFQFEGNFVD